MLTECPECKKSVSSLATSCPHCGYVLIQPSEQVAPPAAKKGALFQILAGIGIVLGLFTPRILLLFPVLFVTAMSIASIARCERRRGLSVVFLIVGALLLIVPSLSSLSTATKQTSYTDSLKISNTTWVKQSGYSYLRGRVQNIGHATVRYFEVKAFYKNQNGAVVDMDYTNSGERLPPGMAKEFEVMHRDSPEHVTTSLAIEKVSLE